MSAEAILSEALSKVTSVRTEMVRFCVLALPRLRAMDFATRKAVLNECSDHSLREPLHHHYKSDLRVAGWQERLNGDQVIALMAIGLFVHMSERLDLCGALVEMFPEIEAALEIEPKVTEALAHEQRAAEQRRLATEAPLFVAAGVIE